MNSLTKYITPAMFTRPDIIVPSTTFGHTPFFFWLISVLHPRNIVELGSFNGYSFFIFCQAAAALGEASRCHAVDTWEGDTNMGAYGPEVYARVKETAAKHFGKNGHELLRMTFDEAARHFDEGSVDLLFIDGCHTYEAVKNDFLTWKSKMSSRGVIMFHDTVEEAPGFGVRRFWAEIKDLRPSLEFYHEHGLGVLLWGESVPGILLELAGEPDTILQQVRDACEALGEKYNIQWQLDVTQHQKEKRERDLGHMRGSLSWKLTSPLRYLDSLVRGNGDQGKPRAASSAE